MYAVTDGRASSASMTTPRLLRLSTSACAFSIGRRTLNFGTFRPSYGTGVLNSPATYFPAWILTLRMLSRSSSDLYCV